MESHPLKDVPDANDRELAVLTACSCPEFLLSELRCKHLFLVARYSGFPIRLHEGINPVAGCARAPVLPAPPPANAVSEEAVQGDKRALEERFTDTVRKILGVHEARPLHESLSRDNMVALTDRLLTVYRDVQEMAFNTPFNATQGY